MTQIYSPADLATPFQSPPLASSWVRAYNIVQKLSQDQNVLNSEVASGRTSVEYAKALSKVAQDSCDLVAPADPTEQTLSDQIRLLANAGYYLHNQKEISHYDNERDVRRLTDEEWQYYQDFKPYMIWYNQLLADYAYTNPQAKLSELNDTLSRFALLDFPDEAEAVERNIKRATRGARTEAASRELLDRTPIDYTPGTIDDDLRGGDLIVMYKDHRVKVDIKSSISDIAAVRGGYDAIDEHHLRYAIRKARRDGNDKAKHVVVIFPGFTDSDLGDCLSLQLPEENIQQHADSLAKQLTLAFRELQL